MEQEELLKRVIEVLESLGVAHMIVGSYASGAWGEPRFTYDIDIVIAIGPGDVNRLVSAFPQSDFYVSAEAARAAVASHGQFNLIHPESGHKVDFMIAPATGWGAQQLARRRLLELRPGLRAWVAAPEDVIISKMLYYREGGSEKHLRDITGMLKVSGAGVDREYVSKWATALGVDDVWQAVLARTDG